MCETLRYEINVVVVVVMVIFVHLDCSITSITCMHNKKVFIEPPRVVCFQMQHFLSKVCSVIVGRTAAYYEADQAKASPTCTVHASFEL